MPPLSTQQPPQIETPNYLLRTTVAILALALVGTASYFGYESYKKIRPVNQQPNQTYLNLKQDENFREAQAAVKRNDYEAALTDYRKVSTDNTAEYSFIQYEIANVLLNINREQGIQAFSDVIASSSINSQTKGYAINALARTYSSSHDQNILDVLKKESLEWSTVTPTPPLIQKFVSAETYDDTYIALLEIGSAHYPIMDSELRLAFAYAKKAREAQDQNNPGQLKLYINKSLEKLESGDSDPNNTKLSENLSWMLPLTLNRKAMTLGLLRSLGEKTEDPAYYFEQALNLATAQGIKVQPFINYNYATYLNNSTTASQKEKITALVQPLAENRNDPYFAEFFEFTKNAYKNNEITNIKNLDALAKIYPPFGEVIR